MTALSPYGTLLVPAVVAVVLIWLAIRIARAIIHLVVVALVIALLVWGYTQYQHVAALQSAAQQLARGAGSGSNGTPASYGAAATVVLTRVRAVLSQAGINPSAIRASVTCAGGEAVLVLRDTQSSGALGLLAGSDVRVHLSPVIHCSGTS